MLVVTRRAGESVVIRPAGRTDTAADIVVTFVGHDGSRVRIGVDTPSGFVVYREEIADARGRVDLPPHNRRIESARDR